MMPMIASGFPPTVWGDFLICWSAIKPSMRAMMPGMGPKQPNIKPKMPVTIETMPSVWFSCAPGRGGGGGGCQTGACGRSGAPQGGVIGGRSSGATHAGGTQLRFRHRQLRGGSRGSHCVSSSDGDSTRGSRIFGSQFGSTGGDSSSISIVPSSEQKVSQTSVYCRLHCGQYFICASD